jgi:hypothetical protein
MRTILLIILVLLILGALPTWPYSAGWGYYPSGGLGLLLVILLILAVLGKLWGVSMKRPTGETVVAVLSFSGAMILALGSCGFFVVGAMAATGDERGEPVSVAIAGMAVAAGFMLLILAGATGWVAMNVGGLRDWMQTVSIRASAASVEARLRGVLTAARRSSLGEFVSSHLGRSLEHHSWRRAASAAFYSASHVIVDGKLLQDSSAANADRGSALEEVAHPEGFEPPTLGSEDRCSIQLSYGCVHGGSQVTLLVRSVAAATSLQANYGRVPSSYQNFRAARRGRHFVYPRFVTPGRRSMNRGN